jgi:hypothetical protein
VDVELVFALKFVLGLKSVDELCHSPPMGIGSEDTSQGGDTYFVQIWIKYIHKILIRIRILRLRIPNISEKDVK